MAIIGAHMLLNTTQPEAVRAILRDVFGFKNVDAGGGWLIFALPPSELGVHPAEGHAQGQTGRHEISFMCDDIAATVAQLKGKGVEIDGVPIDRGFGITVTMKLPGGVEVLLYEPRHPMAINPSQGAATPSA